MNPMLEKMLPMLIKALGIEPQSLLANLTSFQQVVANKLAEFDARIRDMEIQAARANANIVRILQIVEEQQHGSDDTADGFDEFEQQRIAAVDEFEQQRIAAINATRNGHELADR
jgi:hypothetical protein